MRQVAETHRRISIHALRVEGDKILERAVKPPRNFYPRPPGGGRPIQVVVGVAIDLISIHALRVEGDARGSPEAPRRLNFYPRPPGGGRLVELIKLFQASRYFYPRPPGGGRPLDPERYGASNVDISIHALRVEGDIACILIYR